MLLGRRREFLPRSFGGGAELTLDIIPGQRLGTGAECHLARKGQGGEADQLLRAVGRW